MENLVKEVFEINSEKEFEEIALKVFRFQANHVPVYKEFLKLLKVDAEKVIQLKDVPFLPVSVFKTHKVIATGEVPEIVFLSSGTTGMIQSKHHVSDVSIYKQSFISAFEKFYGSIGDYTILALLPSYLEREGSSLIYMVDELIKRSISKESGFYLHNLDELSEKLEVLDQQGKKVLLLGVSYALLDLVEQRNFDLKNVIIMETGGMKGKRKEMIKAELHGVLKSGFGVDGIHSEYGMTELLSQAYSLGNEHFHTPAWMSVMIRDVNDPFSYVADNTTGGINVIDLANIYSCSFIATQDLGKKKTDGTFEVLGRFDNSDIRGCNLLVQ